MFTCLNYRHVNLPDNKIVLHILISAIHLSLINFEHCCVVFLDELFHIYLLFEKIWMCLIGYFCIFFVISIHVLLTSASHSNFTGITKFVSDSIYNKPSFCASSEAHIVSYFAFYNISQ